MNQKAIAGVSALASLCLAAPAFAQAADLSVRADSAGVTSSASSSAPPAPSAPQLQDPSLARRPALFELGIFGGIFFLSKQHALIDRLPHEAYERPAAEIGARFAFLPLPALGLEAEGAAMPTETESGISGGLWAWRGHLIAQIPGHTITPFAVLGMGGLGGGSREMGSDLDPAVHFGIGAKLALDEFIALRLDVRDTLSQKFDADQGTQTHHPEALLGLSFSLRPTKTRAPAQPVGPVDTDRDGFFDPSDRCPTEPGPVEGCPVRDTDGDGVFDDKDACPSEVGKAPCGCPLRDADGDKVIDELDRCPKEPGPIEGCPDPDADRDGILLPTDRCPDQPETKNSYDDADGCPDEVPEKVRKFTGVIAGIEFDTGKATIRRVSSATLDNAALLFKEFPRLRVLITGHTDTVGEREMNIELSRSRAESVKAYIVSQGIDQTRIETRGAGPDEPIADNKTAAGKQKNRRIEFKLITEAQTPPNEAQAPQKGQP